MSEMSQDEVPDTPMIEHRHQSFINDHSLRESLMTTSDYNFRQPSRFQEDYILKGILGKGKFGKVIICQNKLDQFDYAVNITARKIRNCLEKSSFLQKVNALSALSVGFESPHIVRYYSGWIEDQNLYIVVRQFDHISLIFRWNCVMNHSGLILRKEKDQMAIICLRRTSKQIMRDVSLGLNELHAKGIVHLDIKPENILQSQKGTFKIGDLGMARLLTTIIEEHDITEGDCRYLAKELLNEDPNLSIPDLTKANIFALGIIIYELLEGVELMRNGPQWHNLREDKIEFSERTKSLYSNKLLKIVSQMLASSPDFRPSPQMLLQTFLQSPLEIFLLYFMLNRDEHNKR